MISEESYVNLPEIEYEVENILDHKRKRKFNFETKKYYYIKEYLIKWAGYDETTWEPEENLQNCQELLKDYWKLVKINKLRERNRNNNKTPKKLVKRFPSHIIDSNFISNNYCKIIKSCFATPVRVSKNQISSNMSTLSDISSMNDLDKNRKLVETKEEDITLNKKDIGFLSKKSTLVFEDKKDINENNIIIEKNKINFKNSKNKNCSKKKQEDSNAKKFTLEKRNKNEINSSQKCTNLNKNIKLLKRANNFGPSFYDVINANKIKNLEDEFRKFIQKKRKRSESLSSSFSISISDPNLKEPFHRGESKALKKKKVQAFQSNKGFLEISQISIPKKVDESIVLSIKYKNKGKTLNFKSTSREKEFFQQELFDCYEEIIKRELAGKTYKFPDFFLQKGKQ